MKWIAFPSDRSRVCSLLCQSKLADHSNTYDSGHMHIVLKTRSCKRNYFETDIQCSG